MIWTYFFYYFDKFLDGGLFKKELIVIGGGSGTGKSYIAGTTAWFWHEIHAPKVPFYQNIDVYILSMVLRLLPKQTPRSSWGT